ncbi:MAG: FHA domain-containing protein, partial [Planctomycetes bacterium]|nr:FHA domain-containing protein [Planctomycetota bacterium]
MFLISEHEGKPLEYEVRKDVVTIGRDVSCDISLNSTSVSRFHVQMKRDGDRLTVKDLGSRNGTRVNGAKVAEAVLSDGDVIQVGALKMLFRAAPMRPPTGFEPVGPAEPVAPEGPEARDVSPSPTPPDAGFAPEKYRQGLPSGGPKIVERSGKFYLLDAASGREVEIKPVGGGGDPVQAALRQLQGMSPTAKRRMALAGAAVFCVAGIALAAL